MTTLYGSNYAAAMLERLEAMRRRPGRAFVASAPGRVNLIGEHTDYNGYPVLPMAIDRHVSAVFSARGDESVRIENLSPRFTTREFGLGDVNVPYPRGDWGQYVKAAIRGLLDEGYARGPRGFDGVFDGDVPVAAGLSSSSALVVAAALAFLAVNGVTPEAARLAATLARAERYAGIEGGGMDQAVSLLAERGKALRIDFFPLRARALPLPAGCSVVICNSMVEAPKTASARNEYNLRVVECRLATAMIARELQSRFGIRSEFRLPADLETELARLDAGTRDLITDHALADHPMRAAEIADRLGVTPEEIAADYCAVLDGGSVCEPENGFALNSRYRHVVSEAARVEAAELALLRGDASDFGRLMDESHRSCRDDYGVSCPELDELTVLAKEAGALGARLTGAGFGGCTVNLVPSGKEISFMRFMREAYYAPRAGLMAERGIRPENALFACKAAGAAAVRDSAGADHPVDA